MIQQCASRSVRAPDRAEVLPALDSGLTLVELLITLGLLVLVISVTGSILVTGLRVQVSEQGIAGGTGAAQALTRSIARGVGNASSFTVDGATAAGQLLHARVVSTSAAGSTAAACQAWYYSPIYSSLFARTATTALSSAPTVSSSTVAPTGWTLLASGVSLPSGTSAPFAALSSTQLAVNMTVTAGTGARPVVVDTTVAATTQSDTTSLPVTC